MTTPTKPTTPTSPITGKSVTPVTPVTGKPDAPASKPDVPAASKPGVPATGNRPGRKPGQPAKEYDFSGIDLAAINTPKAVTSEMASRMAPSRPRDDRQIAMDAIVRKTHLAWVAAGKPSKWAQMPKVQYNVAPAAEEAFTYLVRRAAEFLGVAIKWGGAGGAKHHDTEGNVIIMFAVRDRWTRDAVDDTDDDGDDYDANGETSAVS